MPRVQLEQRSNVRRGNSTSEQVSGTAPGFASTVTGGGDAAAVTPASIAELTKYLADDQPRVIVLTKTFDYSDSEGTKTSSGCSPWGTATGCQTAIDANSWCENYEPDAPTVSSITYNAAGVEGLTVGSDKTIIGQGSAGVIKGKGLRMANGVSNIIIQNIHVTDINPQYVWGGDGITIDGADLIWIDHCKTSLIGRQHIVLGTESSGRVTISNNELDGQGTYSATCNGNQYWGMYFTGASDSITLSGNYIHHTSGRGPKVGGEGATTLHAVNNYFGPTNGHNFEIGNGASVLAEGNYFYSSATPVEASSLTGALYAVEASDSSCQSALGRACEANAYSSDSGTMTGADSGVFSQFSSASSIAAAVAADTVKTSVPTNAGVGKI
ncbi:unnamed protein product [Discula destructiva]